MSDYGIFPCKECNVRESTELDLVGKGVDVVDQLHCFESLHGYSYFMANV